MNEHKLSALMRYQAGFRKLTGIVGTLQLAARYFKYSTPRSEKLSGAAKKRARWNVPYSIYPPQHRVKRGNPARNPTALV